MSLSRHKATLELSATAHFNTKTNHHKTLAAKLQRHVVKCKILHLKSLLNLMHFAWSLINSLGPNTIAEAIKHNIVFERSPGGVERAAWNIQLLCAGACLGKGRREWRPSWFTIERKFWVTFVSDDDSHTAYVPRVTCFQESRLCQTHYRWWAFECTNIFVDRRVVKYYFFSQTWI